MITDSFWRLLDEKYGPLPDDPPRHPAWRKFRARLRALVARGTFDSFRYHSSSAKHKKGARTFYLGSCDYIGELY